MTQHTQEGAKGWDASKKYCYICGAQLPEGGGVSGHGCIMMPGSTGGVSYALNKEGGMTQTCCEQCNINTASHSKKYGREPSENGCINNICKCHHTQESWREEFSELFPDKLEQTRTHDGKEDGVMVVFDVREQLKAFIETEILKAKGEVLDDIKNFLPHPDFDSPKDPLKIEVRALLTFLAAVRSHLGKGEK